MLLNLLPELLGVSRSELAKTRQDNLLIQSILSALASAKHVATTKHCVTPAKHCVSPTKYLVASTKHLVAPTNHFVAPTALATLNE